MMKNAYQAAQNQTEHQSAAQAIAQIGEAAFGALCGMSDGEVADPDNIATAIRWFDMGYQAKKTSLLR